MHGICFYDTIFISYFPKPPALCSSEWLIVSVSVPSTGLLYIWETRKLGKTTTLYMMRAEPEAAVSIRQRSRLKKVRECGGNTDEYAE